MIPDSNRLELKLFSGAHASLELTSLQDLDQPNLKFKEGHSYADALLWTQSKGQVTKRWALLDLFWKKTIWVEAFRL